MQQIADTGAELTHQLLGNAAFLKASEDAVPERFRVPHCPAHPHFMTADFGLVREDDGSLAPRLVELQAFPSIFGLQAVLFESYARTFNLAPNLERFLSGLDDASYWTLLRSVIVGNHAPENVVLLEIEPEAQKTLPDFHVHEDRLGIRTVDIAKLKREGRRLFYRNGTRDVPIERIYNRAIVDELERKGITLPFDYRDDLDVEWAGHPNWYFRISKFAIPWLHHPAVPPAVFLNDWYDGKGRGLLAEDREQWVFKPLYSFAGKGVQFAPTDAELTAIPDSPASRLPAATARALRASHRHAARAYAGGSTHHVRVARRRSARAGHQPYPHGPRQNDGRRSQPQSGMGRGLRRILPARRMSV